MVNITDRFGLALLSKSTVFSGSHHHSLAAEKSFRRPSHIDLLDFVAIEYLVARTAVFIYSHEFLCFKFKK